MSEKRESLIDLLSSSVREGVGERVRLAREEAGMSQAELAERIGRRQAYVSDVETGKTEPNATTLAVLAKILAKPVAFFFPESWRDPVQWTLKPDELTIEEQELFKELRKLDGFYYHTVAIHLFRALLELSQKQDDEMNRQSGEKDEAD